MRDSPAIRSAASLSCPVKGGKSRVPANRMGSGSASAEKHIGTDQRFLILIDTRGGFFLKSTARDDHWRSQ